MPFRPIPVIKTNMPINKKKASDTQQSISYGVKFQDYANATFQASGGDRERFKNDIEKGKVSLLADVADPQERMNLHREFEKTTADILQKQRQEVIRQAQVKENDIARETITNLHNNMQANTMDDTGEVQQTAGKLRKMTKAAYELGQINNEDLQVITASADTAVQHNKLFMMLLDLQQTDPDKIPDIIKNAGDDPIDLAAIAAFQEYNDRLEYDEEAEREDEQALTEQTKSVLISYLAGEGDDEALTSYYNRLGLPPPEIINRMQTAESESATPQTTESIITQITEGGFDPHAVIDNLSDIRLKEAKLFMKLAKTPDLLYNGVFKEYVGKLQAEFKGGLDNIPMNEFIDSSLKLAEGQFAELTPSEIRETLYMRYNEASKRGHAIMASNKEKIDNKKASLPMLAAEIDFDDDNDKESQAAKVVADITKEVKESPDDIVEYIESGELWSGLSPFNRAEAQTLSDEEKVELAVDGLTAKKIVEHKENRDIQVEASNNLIENSNRADGSGGRLDAGRADGMDTFASIRLAAGNDRSFADWARIVGKDVLTAHTHILPGINEKGNLEAGTAILGLASALNEINNLIYEGYEYATGVALYESERKKVAAMLEPDTKNFTARLAGELVTFFTGYGVASVGKVGVVTGKALSNLPKTVRDVSAVLSKTWVSELVAFGAEEENLLRTLAKWGLLNENAVEAMLGGEADNDVWARVQNANTNTFFEFIVGVGFFGVVKVADKGTKFINRNQSEGFPTASQSAEVPKNNGGMDEVVESGDISASASDSTASSTKGDDVPDNAGVDISKARKLAAAWSSAITNKLRFKKATEQVLSGKGTSEKDIIKAAQQSAEELRNGYIPIKWQGVTNNGDVLAASPYNSTSRDWGHNRPPISGISNGEVLMDYSFMEASLKKDNSENKFVLASQIQAALHKPSRVYRLADGGMAYRVLLGDATNLTVKLSPEINNIDNVRKVTSVEYDSDSIATKDVMYEKTPKGEIEDPNYRLSMIKTLSRRVQKTKEVLEAIERSQKPYRKILRESGFDENIADLNIRGKNKLGAIKAIRVLEETVEEIARYNHNANNILSVDEIAKAQKAVGMITDFENRFLNNLVKTANQQAKLKKAGNKARTADRLKDDPTRDYYNLWLSQRNEIGNREIGRRYGKPQTQKLWWYQFFKGRYPSNHHMAGELRNFYDSSATNAPGFFLKAEKNIVGSQERYKLDSFPDSTDAPEELLEVRDMHYARNNVDGQGSSMLDEREALEYAKDEWDKGGYKTSSSANSERQAYDEFANDTMDMVGMEDLPDPREIDNFEDWFKSLDRAGNDIKPIAERDLDDYIPPFDEDNLAGDIVDDVLDGMGVGDHFRDMDAGLKAHNDEFNKLTENNTKLYEAEYADDAQKLAAELGVDLEKFNNGDPNLRITAIAEALRNQKWFDHLSDNEAANMIFNKFGKLIKANSSPISNKAQFELAQQLYKGSDVEILKGLKETSVDNMAATFAAGAGIQKAIVEGAIKSLQDALAKIPKEVAMDKDLVDILPPEVITQTRRDFALAYTIQEKTQNLISQGGRLLQLGKMAKKEDMIRFQHAKLTLNKQDFEKTGAPMSKKNLNGLLRYAVDMSDNKSDMHEIMALAATNDRDFATITSATNELIVRSILTLSSVFVGLAANVVKVPLLLGKKLAIGATGDYANLIYTLTGRNQYSIYSQADATNYLIDMIRHGKLAIKNAGRAFVDGYGNQYGTKNGYSNSAELAYGDSFNKQPHPSYGNVAKNYTKTVGGIAKPLGFLNTRWMSMIDELFKTMIYHASIAESSRKAGLVAVETAKRSGEVDGNVLAKIRKDEMDKFNDVKRIPISAIEQAGNDAHKLTSTQRLPEWLETVSQTVNRNLFLKMTIPVFKTIINDHRWGFRDTILGALAPAFDERTLKGNLVPKIVRDVAAGDDRMVAAVGTLAFTVGLYQLFQAQDWVKFELDNDARGWKASEAMAIADGKPEWSLNILDFDMQGTRLGNVFSTLAINKLVSDGWASIIAEASSWIYGSTAPDDVQEKAVWTIILRTRDMIEENAALGGIRKIARGVTSFSVTGAEKAFVEYVSILNPTNAARWMLRVGAPLLPEGSFGDRVSKYQTINYNSHDNTAENLITKVGTGWAPMQFYPAHDWAGVPKAQTRGFNYILGKVRMREHNETEIFVAKWHAHKQIALSEVPKFIIVSEAVRRNTGSSSYKLTPEELSYHQSLRAAPLVFNSKGELVDYPTGLRDFLETRVRNEIEKRKKEGTIDDLPEYTVNDVKHSEVKEYSKKFGWAMKAMFYNKFRELVPRVDFGDRSLDEYRKAMDRLIEKGVVDDDKNFFNDIKLERSKQR